MTDKESVEKLVRGVHGAWKADVAAMVQGILRQGGFSNFALGGAICRKLLFEVTRANTRAWEIVRQELGPNAFSKYFVAPVQLRDEFAAAMKALGFVLEM